MVSLFNFKSNVTEFDITLFQTPKYGDDKGYKAVYRLLVPAKSHEDALDKTFRKFNIPDTMPPDYEARYVATGDIILIDEGKRGQTYYQLQSGGWVKVNRIHVR
ncbi:YodL domain-containing protein [Bacillus sp. FJAT-47783]|uniref:YodL domain-containing protein n=1 Tax=Bacillus sp. FJAT-47783 TaxID=2922712 RepID=UPI00243493D0|nr:YodL domain-containing protein [Bacillus sp. FJAT-47783]